MLNKFFKNLDKSILSSCFVYDYARSAEKMLDWSNLGNSHPTWNEDGPYLSSGANVEQINHDHPYCLRISKECAMAAYLVLGDPIEVKVGNKGIQVDLYSSNEEGSRVEPIIAKLAIIDLFELYKAFLISFDGPFNSKKAKEWANIITKDLYETTKSVVDRRNELTHDKEYKLPTMKEAVEYFNLCKQLAEILYNIHIENKKKK